MPNFIRHAPAGLMWLGAGAVAITVEWATPGSGGRTGTWALGGLAILFGGWVFWRHGGSRITAVGVYNLAFAVFVGFGGLYHANRSASIDLGVPLLTVVLVGFFGQVLTWLFFWSGGPPSRPKADVARADARTSAWAVRYGVVLLVLAVALSLNAATLDLLIKAAGFVGVVLLGTGLLRGPLGRWTVLCGVLIAVAFTVYFTYLFSGFGRIVIGSLALVLLVVVAERDRRRRTKAVVLVGAAPVLLFLAGLRAGGPASTVDGDGFQSAVSPAFDFAQLLQLNADGLLPHVWGETFYTASVALIPRAWWTEKPVGFGTELVPFVAPHLVGTEHSAAALWHGEWLYNFGLPGLVLMVPVTGLAVRGLDWLLARASSRPLNTPLALSAYAASVMAVVGLFDLVWVGSFTYMARSGARLLVLAALVATVGWLVPRLRAPVGRRHTAAGLDGGQNRPAGAPDPVPAAGETYGFGTTTGWDGPKSRAAGGGGPTRGARRVQPGGRSGETSGESHWPRAGRKLRSRGVTRLAAACMRAIISDQVGGR